MSGRPRGPYTVNTRAIVSVGGRGARGVQREGREDGAGDHLGGKFRRRVRVRRSDQSVCLAARRRARRVRVRVRGRVCVRVRVRVRVRSFVRVSRVVRKGFTLVRSRRRPRVVAVHGAGRGEDERANAARRREGDAERRRDGFDVRADGARGVLTRRLDARARGEVAHARRGREAVIRGRREEGGDRVGVRRVGPDDEQTRAEARPSRGDVAEEREVRLFPRAGVRAAVVEVVQRDDARAALQEGFAEVTPDEPRPAGHEHGLLRLAAERGGRGAAPRASRRSRARAPRKWTVPARGATREDASRRRGRRHRATRERLAGAVELSETTCAIRFRSADVIIIKFRRSFQGPRVRSLGVPRRHPDATPPSRASVGTPHRARARFRSRGRRRSETIRC